MHYLFLTFALVITSCGQQTYNAPSKDSFVKRSLGRAIPLTKIHPTCDRVASSSSKEFDILRFIEGQMLGEKIDFSSIITGSKFAAKSSTFYNKVAYGGKFEIFYEINRAGNEKQVGLKQKANAAELNVCAGSDYTNYPLSYEDVALSSVPGIQAALDAVKAAKPKIKLNPVKFVMGPDYKMIYRTTYKVQGKKKGQLNLAFVNNAFYNGGTSEIVFLPQGYMGEDKVIPFGGVPLWKIPMVGAHEYGHHVFREIVGGKALDTASKEFHDKFCWDSRHVHVSGSTKIEKMAGTGEILGAYNEGFADLIAYYSLGKEIGSLKGISCMEKAREVDVSEFADGTAKKLDFNAYFTFMHGGESPDSCLEPDYTDIHIMGAIFAHHFDQLMEKIGMEPQEKLKTLLEWAQILKSKYGNLTSGYKALMEIYLTKGGIKSDACTYLKQNAEAIHSDLDC